MNQNTGDKWPREREIKEESERGGGKEVEAAKMSTVATGGSRGPWRVAESSGLHFLCNGLAKRDRERGR